MDFGRVITAMVTPFDSNLEVNYEVLERFVDYLIDEQGSESIVVCGTTGESPTLTEEEKLEVFNVVTARAKGRSKIIAGTGTYDTAHTVHMTKQVERIGVDGVLLVSPYYNRPDQNGLYTHFRSVAEQTSLPVMLYNIPKRTGVTIEADTILRLARDCSNIVATKEAHADLDLITSIIGQAPDGFKVYSGDDIMTLPMMSIGAHGVVSVASHVIGGEIHRMIQSFLSGNVAEAARMHGSLQEKFNALFLRPNPVMVKAVLRNKGVDVGGVRLPLVNGSDEEERYVCELFA